MRINGTDNFITDQDIIVTSTTDAGNLLSSVITKLQEDIDVLKSNVKWIYKYGGVGSGSGGSGSSGTWKAAISINNTNVANNSTLDLSPYIDNDVVSTQVTVTISNPSAGGYKFAVLFKYDGSDYQSLGTNLTVDNSYSCTFNVKFTMNSTISIKVTDIENNFNEYNINYYIFGYDCTITPLYKADDGTETYITTLNIRSGNYVNGIIFRLTINNYAGFTINYAPISTLKYTLTSINKEEPSKYNNIISETESYYLLTENKGFMPASTTQVILDYLIDYPTLSTESNFGALIFKASLNVITNGKSENNTYPYEYNNVPDTKEFIIYTNDSAMGTIYNDNTEDADSVDYLYSGNTITLKFRPFNYSTSTVILQYTLTDAENNVYNGSFSIANERFTSQSFPVYNGWNKLNITGISDTIYYYGKQLSVSINWYSDIDLGASYNNLSKSELLYQSYYRFNNGLSSNLNNVSILKTATSAGYYKCVKTTNESTTPIDLWGTNSIEDNTAVFGANTADMHLALGIQYSAANDYDDPILSITNSNGDTLMTLYREKIDCDFFIDNDVTIYIPTTSNFTSSNKDEYHLIDIYFKRLLKVTVLNRNDAGVNVETDKDIWKLSSKATAAEDVTDKWQMQIYIDGITDGVLTDFVTTFPLPRYINLYDINAYYNLFELTQCKNDKISFSNVDAVLYWYTYKQYMTENTGINTTSLKLISNLATVEASGSTPTRKHNLVKISLNYLTTLSGNSNIPVYIINVPHLNNDAKENTVFLWLNKEYSETESVISWPVLSSTDADGNHYTGISYYAPGSNAEIKINFPNTTDWTLTLFLLDLQGSSTRMNHGKNLDLSLYNKSLASTTTFLYSPNYDSADSDTYLPENKFTLKADVVDSGHTNNAVMGKFINDNTDKFITGAKGAHKDYVKNCLNGFPCIIVLAVDYLVDGTDTEYYYLGIYNFNLGRASYSNLGYRDISIFDGNISSVTAATPFCFYKDTIENLEIKEGFGAAEISGGNPKYDFSQWDKSILFQQKDEPEGNSYMWGDIVTRNEGILLNAILYFVRDIALSGGYLFNVLGKSVKDHSEWDGWYYKNTVPDVTKQYSKNSDFSTFKLKETIDIDSDTYNWQYAFEKTIHDVTIDGLDYVTRLDYNSALEYYTICMAFGLVDSVLKNLNIKTWTLNDTDRIDPKTKENRAKFYISFYDMDTCLGIDNNSEDTSPFCFSDYWDSKQSEISEDTYHLESINVYRDYFDKDAKEVGFDIPSSFLFAIVKYGTSVYNAVNEETISQEDYLTPSDLWARYRASSKLNYSDLGTGVASLQSASTFMTDYYKKHLSGVSELLFNLDYDAKYVTYKLSEKWERPTDANITKDIGTYELADDLSDFLDTFHSDLSKFRGRSIYRVYDWLTSRIHMLDAYFNLTSATEFISVDLDDENNRIAAASLYTNTLTTAIETNSDVQTKYLMFNYGGQTKFSIAGALTLLLKALKYTPLMFIDAGTIKQRYLLLNPGYTYEITINVTGNVDMVLAGSLSLTYISNITWVHPTQLSITSSYLTDIIGLNPVTNVLLTSINCSALLNLQLVGSTYSGSISLTYNSATDATDTYSNLLTIDIHNSNINLTVKNEPVTSINMSYVTATTSSIEACYNLALLQDGSSPVKLTGATFNTSLTLNVNWTDSIEFNDFEVNLFLILCTKLNATNNTLIIDGYKNSKFKTLTLLTITGYSNIIVYSCPKLSKVIITDPTTVKSLIIVDCSTSVTSFSLYSGSTSVSNTLQMKAFTNLKEICFMNTLNFTKVILPDGFNFIGGEFIGCSNLTYLDALTTDGTAGTITITDLLATRTFYHLNNTKLVSTISNGIFLNCYNYTLTKAADNPTISPIWVSNSVTTLANLFSCASTASTAISLTSIAAFINRISINNNITSINSICRNLRGINLGKEQYIADTKDSKSTLCLGVFKKVIDASYAFSPYTGTSNVYINKWIWYDSTKKYILGQDNGVSYITVTCIFNPLGGINLYLSINALYPILNRMALLPSGGWTWNLNLYPVYSNTTETYTVITNLSDAKHEEAAYASEDYYIKTFKYEGTNSNCGDIIPSVSLRNIFVDEHLVDSTNIESTKSKAIYPTLISSLSGLSLSTNTTWNLYGFISKEWTNLKLITGLLYNSGIIKAAEYEDLLGPTFMPAGLYNVKVSFNNNFNTTSTYIDFSRFLDYDTLINNANTKTGLVMFSNSEDSSITYDTLAINKTIDSTTFRRWLKKTINANVKGVRSLFRNCIVIADDGTDDDFRILSGTNINKNIITVDRLFYNMTVRTSSTGDPMYIHFGYDLFKYLPNVVVARETFYNTYWKEPIPFNFFNKRQYTKYTYYLDNGDDTRTAITYNSYTYRKELTYTAGCFYNVHWDPSLTKCNTYNETDADGKTINELGYNTYVYAEGANIGDTVVVKKRTKVYTTKDGYTTTYMEPSYEYLDTLNLHGSFYWGRYAQTGSLATNNTNASQVFPLTDTTVPNYTNNLMVAPDILYGCTSTCTVYNMFNLSGLSKDMLTGILPLHLLMNISTPTTNNLLNIFCKCLVIPNYIGTYTLYSTYTNSDDAEDTYDFIKLAYNIYTFIPENFIQSETLTNLSYAFNFYMHWPELGSMVGSGDTARYNYDFYVVSTKNSFTSKITSLAYSYPSVITNGSSIRTWGDSYINYHSYDFGIHYNLMGSYYTYEQLATKESPYSRTEAEKLDIFGSIYTSNPDMCVEIALFNTGIDMTYFTNLKVDNLITSINLLSGYFGYIFDESTLISKLSYASDSTYCIIDTTNVNQWTGNTMSCNIIFPKSNDNNGKRFLLFIPESGTTGNQKPFNIYTSLLQDTNSRTSYATMFSKSLTQDSGTKPVYYTSE